MLSKPIDSFWTSADRTRLTKDFCGMSGLRYHDVTVRVLELADNAAVVVDEGGIRRVILWADMSFASEHIARQNQGAIALLKIRRWS